VAGLHELPASQLGLRRETRALPADASASEVIQEMRRKIRESEPAPVRPPLPKWLLPAAVAGGCALVFILVWLLTRS
jgi:hypothetical protein